MLRLVRGQARLERLPTRPLRSPLELAGGAQVEVLPLVQPHQRSSLQVGGLLGAVGALSDRPPGAELQLPILVVAEDLAAEDVGGAVGVDAPRAGALPPLAHRVVPDLDQAAAARHGELRQQGSVRAAAALLHRRQVLEADHGPGQQRLVQGLAL